MRLRTALIAGLAASHVGGTTVDGQQSTTTAYMSTYTGPMTISDTASVISSIASVMSIASIQEQHAKATTSLSRSNSSTISVKSSSPKPIATTSSAPKTSKIYSSASTARSTTADGRVTTSHTTSRHSQSSRTPSLHFLTTTRTLLTTVVTNESTSKAKTSKSSSSSHSHSASGVSPSSSRSQKSSGSAKSTTKSTKTTARTSTKPTKTTVKSTNKSIKTTVRTSTKPTKTTVRSTSKSTKTTTKAKVETIHHQTTKVLSKRYFVNATAPASATWSTTSTTNPCDEYPAIYTYVPPDPSVTGFLSDEVFYNTSMTANAPMGFTWLWAAYYASLMQVGYLGYANLDAYNVTYCGEYCNDLAGCMAFDIYYQRQESNTPIGCTPTAQTIIRCAFYGQSIDVKNLTNIGQWTDGFAVVIAGSNGYSKSAPTNITSAGS